MTECAHQMRQTETFFTQCNGAVSFLAAWLVENNRASVFQVALLNKAVAHAVNKCKRPYFCAGLYFDKREWIFGRYSYCDIYWFLGRLDNLRCRRIERHCGVTTANDFYLHSAAKMWIHIRYVLNAAENSFYFYRLTFSIIKCVDRGGKPVRVCNIFVGDRLVGFETSYFDHLEHSTLPYLPIAPDCPFTTMVEAMPNKRQAIAKAIFYTIRSLDHHVFTKNNFAHLYNAFVTEINATMSKR